MINWYKKVVFENYANFSGRARRSEFWYFILANSIIALVLYIPMLYSIINIDPYTEEIGSTFFIFYGILMLYSLATFIPNLALTVRRLHDVGKSGWFYLVGIIPFVGAILLLYWFCQDGELNENKWGHNPKNNYSDIDEIGA